MFPFSILWGASRYHIRSAQYSHCGILAEIEVAKHSAETFDSWIPKQGSSHKRMSKRHITDSTNIQYIWLGFSLFPATCITLSPIYRQRLSDCLVYCFLIPSQSKTHDYRKKDAWMEFLFVRNWICFKGKEKKLYGLENIMPLLRQPTRKQCWPLVQGVPPFQGLCLSVWRASEKPQRRWILSNLTRGHRQGLIWFHF